jgi:hypothetical protein
MNYSEYLLDVIVEKVFEKSQKDTYINFILFVSITSLSCKYLKYSINNKFEESQSHINMVTDKLSYDIIFANKQQIFCNDNTKNYLNIINNKLDDIITNQKNIIYEIEELKKHKDHLNCSNTTTSASVKHFSPIITNIFDDTSDQEYDELSNECYDNIPLNNLKKNNSLSWLYNISRN